MMERFNIIEGWSAYVGRIRAAGPVVVGLVMIIGCEGDTLYDADLPPIPPPSVAISRPVGGQQVLAGRRVPIQVTAADSLGVSRIDINYSGVVSGSIQVPFAPPRGSVTLDTAVLLPAGLAGTIDFRASSRNALGVTGSSDEVRINVATTDVVAPMASLEVISVPSRMELTDSIRVRIAGQDNPGGSGLARLGLTVLVMSSAHPNTLAFERITDFAAPQHDGVSREIVFAPPFATRESLPQSMRLVFHAFAVDSAGNCAAATTPTLQQLGCNVFTDASGEHIVAAGAGPEATTRVVAGRSVALSAGSLIMDAIADVGRSRLYLSNHARSRVEVLDLALFRFSSPVSVGSEPWGIDLTPNSDTLIVANSGGTSISYVNLTITPAREELNRRIRTTNTPLIALADTSWSFVDYSDRPQFLVQDSQGRIIYSTLPTDFSRPGVIHISRMQAGWQQPEINFIIPPAPNVCPPYPPHPCIVAHIDSARYFVNLAGQFAGVELYDHPNGSPGAVITSGVLPTAAEAVQVLAANPQSDIRVLPGAACDPLDPNRPLCRLRLPGSWPEGLLAFQDTTFVARSGDRTRVIIGEGVADAGRIILWDSPRSTISNEIRIVDLVGNASEHILDVALSGNGSVGIARGSQGAYWFKNDDLRLEGFVRPDATAGRSGAVLHPDHPSYCDAPARGCWGPLPPSGATTIAFVDAGRIIRIMDTTHFRSRGEIELRDRVIGPLRVSRQLPGQEGIVAMLYAVTEAGTVVVIDVRASDIREIQ